MKSSFLEMLNTTQEYVLFTDVDACKLCGISIALFGYHKRVKKDFPKASLFHGNRKWYSFDDVCKIGDYFRTEKLATVGQYLKACQVEKKLGYHGGKLTRELEEFAKLGIGVIKNKWRVYTLADVEKIRRYFKSREYKRHDNGRAERTAAGLYTIVSAAEFLRVPLISFRYHLDHDEMPRPTHRHGQFLCYSTEEVEGLRKWFGEDRRRLRHKAIARGLASMAMIADEVGVSKTGLACMVRRGKLPAPTIKLGHHVYYDKETADKVRAYYAK